MPPILKKIIAVAVLLLLANVGFAWYGQANYEATLKSLGKAFVDDNTTGKLQSKSEADLPSAIARHIGFSDPKHKAYRAIALQFDGTYSIKADKPMKMHTLTLLRPTPDMLWGVRLDPYPLITFNAIETCHTGRATMQTLLFGIIPMAKLEGAEFARSELARLLAYSLFNPSLLKCACIHYKMIDTNHTMATIEDGNLTASVTFSNDEQGRIVEVSSQERVRSIKKKLYPASWRMRILSYKEVEGVRLPATIEECWVEKDGRTFPYARYALTSATFL